jgi:hypothetical protein
VEQGVVKRQAGEHLEAAVKHKERANWHGRRAKHLREIAGSVDEVLSGLVAKVATDVKVAAGRLVTTTKRGNTYFADLSPGERWKMAIGIAVKVLGRGCLLVVPQECWEALDPINRQVVAEAAVASGVVILTALPTDDEIIKAEVIER